MVVWGGGESGKVSPVARTMKDKKKMVVVTRHHALFWESAAGHPQSSTTSTGSDAGNVLTPLILIFARDMEEKNEG